MKLKPDQEKDASKLLQDLPLFTGCAPEFIAALVKVLDVKDLAPGKVLLMDQEIARTLFILVRGSVGVWKRVGGEKVQLATLDAPNFFGERSMFEESPASALVKSQGICQVYAVERQHFDPIATQFSGNLELIRKNMIEVRLKRMGPTPPTPSSSATNPS